MAMYSLIWIESIESQVERVWPLVNYNQRGIYREIFE